MVRLACKEAIYCKRPVEARALGEGRRLRNGARRGLGQPRHGIGAAGEHQAHAELAAARLGCEALDARGESLAHQLQHETVGRGQNERVVGSIHLGCEGTDPSIELLRGEFLLETAQAGIPEILHLVIGPKRSRILLAWEWLIHSENCSRKCRETI